MRYMLLIVGDESQYANMSEEERAASSGAWADYTKALTDAGAFVSGDGLQSSTTATTLRVEGGERILTDGPFVETKETIGGFYVIECKDLDQALALAKLCPSPNIEVRPVMDTRSGTTPPA